MTYADRDHFLAVLEGIKYECQKALNRENEDPVLGYGEALRAIRAIAAKETKKCEGKVYWRMKQTVNDKPGALRELGCNSPRRPGTDFCEFHHDLKDHFDQKEEMPNARTQG